MCDGWRCWSEHRFGEVYFYPCKNFVCTNVRRVLFHFDALLPNDLAFSSLYATTFSLQVSVANYVLCYISTSRDTTHQDKNILIATCFYNDDDIESAKEIIRDLIKKDFQYRRITLGMLEGVEVM